MQDTALESSDPPGPEPRVRIVRLQWFPQFASLFSHQLRSRRRTRTPLHPMSQRLRADNQLPPRSEARDGLVQVTLLGGLEKMFVP